MTDREALINELDEPPDFAIQRLRDIIHYIRLGIESEYISKSGNEFYNSRWFKDLVSESIAEYRDGKTDEMDIGTPLIRH